MKTYIITYDLKDTSKDYMPLYDAIKSLSDNYDPWQHFLESAWLVRTELTAKEISEKLMPHLCDNKNLLFVSEIDLDNNDGWIGVPTWKWLKNEKENNEGN